MMDLLPSDNQKKIKRLSQTGKALLISDPLPLESGEKLQKSSRKVAEK